MKKAYIKGTLRECCMKPENLEKQPSDKPELVIKRCKICGRRHYTLLAREAFKGIFN